MVRLSIAVVIVRIRRMGEGNSFSLLVCPGAGGVPALARSRQGGRGYPMVPTSLAGSGQWGRRYPKVPTPQVKMGWGTPRYLPPTHSAKDLLHSGQYASCIHAGGPSCYFLFLLPFWQEPQLCPILSSLLYFSSCPSHKMQ